MGLIQAGLAAAGSTLADQWLEYFYCEALDKEVMVAKGKKRTSRGSSNKRGNDNVISNGSIIAVADGQCMVIVEQGKVVDFCAVPGEYKYDTSTEPSIFSGKLGEGIKNTFKTIGKRFAFGGDAGKDQRVYYFNTKELIDNKFGTPNPIPFRVVDSKVGLDIDVSVRCSGTYSFIISDPLLFYTNVCGNVESVYTRDELAPQLKSEFVSALAPALAKISDLEIRPNQIPAHTTDLENALNEVLSNKWGEVRGLKIVSIALNPITLPKEDEQAIKDAQKEAQKINLQLQRDRQRIDMLQDPTSAAALMAGSQADAMTIAAGNSAGAMTGFMGMGMAQQSGGLNAQNLYAMGQQQRPQQAAPQINPGGAAGGWVCPNCGKTATGKFCMECGTKKPEEDGWTCSCGAVNKGKFCSECGKPRPAGAPLYRCDKCGWEPEDPYHPPKFCPECGDPFDDNDIVS